MQQRLLLPCSIPRPSSTPRISSQKPSHHHTHSVKYGTDNTSRVNSYNTASDLNCLSTAWMTDWNFEVLEYDLQLEGYQIYAVEKWIVERNRANVLLTVYTGDPSDKINVAVLSPHSALETSQAQKEWDKAIHELRRDGARPRETEHGITMVTSLANFRSDFTVVYIPGGNFLAYRDRLYANINLLRMGCSGRSALTLQNPTDATRERFISTYHFRDAQNASPNPSIVVAAQRSSDWQLQSLVKTVLELVKLIQTGLMLFKMFPTKQEELNGLLCDITVDGIQKWVMEIGEPYFNLEPSERILDPSTVSGLLSVIIATRNKLAALGFNQHIPKDPFLDPFQFIAGVNIFETKLHSNDTHTHSQVGLQLPAKLDSGLTTGSPGGEKMKKHPEHFLTFDILWRIDHAYDANHPSRSSTSMNNERMDRERYRDRFQRAIRGKLDDLTATASATAGTLGWWPGDGDPNNMASFVDATCDIEIFVKKIGGLNLKEKDRDKESGKEKEGVKEREVTAASLKLLWCGRPEAVARKRAGSLSVWNESDREKNVDENKAEDEQDEQDGVGLGIGSLPWSNKVQKKFEEWKGKEFARVRSKRPSVDTGWKLKTIVPLGQTSNLDGRITVNSASHPPFPKDFQEASSAFSSGQATPISPATSTVALSLGLHNSAETSTTNMSTSLGNNTALDAAEYNRRVAQITRPTATFSDTTQRLSTTSNLTQLQTGSYDYLSNPRLVNTPRREENLTQTESYTFKPTSNTGQAGAKDNISGFSDEGMLRTSKSGLLRRRHTFPDVTASNIGDSARLSIAEMQTDVDLCAQLLVSRRRQARVQVVLTALETLLPATAESNLMLQQLLDSIQVEMKESAEKLHVTSEIEEILRRADEVTRDTQALAYEALGFDTPRLWQMAHVPRQRVFTIRQRVFGDSSTKRKALTNTRGRFHRVQRTIDRRERYVDWMGRTESEVEEESDLPDIVSDEEDDSLPEPPPTKPTGGWLLAFFTRWGNVLGTGREKDKSENDSNERLKEAGDISKNDQKVSIPEVRITNADEEDESKSDVYRVAHSNPDVSSTDDKTLG